MRWIFVLMLAFFGPRSACAVEPSNNPQLRIETGSHTSTVARLSVDRAERLLLTVSFDKTARLWDLPGRRLLRVLRPPVDQGDEGKLYAGALSPDGRLAAVGGDTGSTWDHKASVYIFDTFNGHLVRRLEGLPGVVNDLAFSRNGRWLAAGLGLGKGIRLWEATSWNEVSADTDYGDSCLGLSWDGDARLATSCLDGKIRLYSWYDSDGPPRSLAPGRATVPVKGKRPFGVRFSPDGLRLVVGFYDHPKVSVLSGRNLSLLFTPDTAAGDDASLSTVAWSADGSILIAGRGWNRENDSRLRFWTGGGRGAGRNLAVARDTVFDLRAVSDDSLLCGIGDGQVGVVDLATFKVNLSDVAVADRRSPLEKFCLSPSADTVLFNHNRGGRLPAIFSLPKRTLTTLPADYAPPATLHPPLLTGLSVTDWKNATVTKLRGRPLKLENDELSRSLVISADASFFLLGTDWNLRCISATSEELWKVIPPDIVWNVNLSLDNRLAVAAYGDGSIRWYRSDTHEELLAFFPHPDKRRWVLWTPEGYYDASPGAEDLIGWHVNRGKDRAADFFSASRFRNVYYRPDVISRVLQTRDIGEALRLANRERGLPATELQDIKTVIARLAPPVVELATGGGLGNVTLPAEATELKVRYRVRQTGEKATEKVTVRFNGRLLDAKAPLPKYADDLVEAKVSLPAGMSGELSIVAGHELATSEAAVLRIERRPGGKPPRKPDLYMLAVGVGDLKMNVATDNTPFPNLSRATSDARLLAKTFQAQEGLVYGHVDVRILPDTHSEATLPALHDALVELARKAQRPEDVAVVFVSAHGDLDPKLGYYLVTYDTDPMAPAATSLTGKELSDLLESIRARTILVLDTCHAAGALGGTSLQRTITSPNDLTGLVNALSSAEQGTIVFSASGVTEQSLEDTTEGGVFTQAFCEGLTSKHPAARNGRLTCQQMQDWLAERVPELVNALIKDIPDEPRQTPVCVIPKGVPDFPLADP